MLLTLTLVVSRSILLVVVTFFAVLIDLWKICALFYYVLVKRVLAFPLPGKQLLFYLSAIDLIVARCCYRGPHCVCCS